MHARSQLLDLIALVVANMIGVGIFTTSGLAVQAVGSRSLLLALWAAGGLYAVLGAVVYGYLARAHPQNGGEHRLLRELGHPAWGFGAGVVSLTAGFTGPLAAAGLALDAYTLPGVGAAAIVGFGALHALASVEGLRLQTVAVAAKVVLVLAILVVAAQARGALGGPDPAADAGAAFGVLVWITFSYTGWNAAVYVAGEHEPARIARAGVVAAGVVTLLYLALNLAFLYSGPLEAVAGRVDVAVAAAEHAGPELVTATRVVAAIALLTSISSLAVAGGRVVQSMGRANELGPISSRLAEGPGAGVALLAGGGLLAYVVASLPSILATAGWMLAGCSALTVLAGLRRGVFGGVGGRLAAGTFVLGTGAVLVGSAQHQPVEAAISAGVFLVATGMAALWYRRGRGARALDQQ